MSVCIAETGKFDDRCWSRRCPARWTRTFRRDRAVAESDHYVRDALAYVLARLARGCVGVQNAGGVLLLRPLLGESWTRSAQRA